LLFPLERGDATAKEITTDAAQWYEGEKAPVELRLRPRGLVVFIHFSESFECLLLTLILLI